MLLALPTVAGAQLPRYGAISARGSAYARATADSSSPTAVYTAAFGAGVSSPPSSGYRQGFAVVGNVDLYPSNLPIGFRLDGSWSTMSAKEGTATGQLSALSLGGILGLAGEKTDPAIWIFGGVSYARAELYDYDTQAESTSGYSAGHTVGAGIRLSAMFSVEVRAHTVNGTTWIPVTLSLRP
ncbi:MAG: hypothetical protein IT359_16370 [Gemmatimonadaceae bacterium]|nr:hypothetical protein [Gemmatimonadaceae bacterium]